MLKTTRSPDKPAPSKNNCSKPASGRNNGNGEVDEVGGVEHTKKLGKLKGQKMFKSRKLSKSGKSKSEKPKKPSKSGNSPNFGATESGPSFLAPEARSPFNRLRLAFTKAPILRYFDSEYHIWIKTDALGYVISDVLSQLASGTSLDWVITKTNLGQWHSIVFFSRKMIPTKTWYETHNGELLAIVKAFKTWRHYLEGYKHKVLILTDHNNFCRFMDTKSLSSRQVRWA